MIFFLDTNICIYFLKGAYPRLPVHFQSCLPGDIKIPSIVKAELLYGAEKSKQKTANLRRVTDFLTPFETVPFGDKESLFYACIRAGAEAKGFTVGPNDLIIAATVLSHNGTLVTKNTKEFSRIPNLKIADWTI